MSPESTTLPPIVVPMLPPIAIMAAVQAENRRDAILMSMRQLPKLASPTDALAYANALRDAKTFVTTIEKSRKEVKAPILDITRAIDRKADELCDLITGEMVRIGYELGMYQRAESEKQRIAEDKVKAEKERLIRAGAGDEQVMAVNQQLEGASAKVAGIAVRTQIHYEVEDIHALYKAHPMLCCVEPRDGFLKEYLKTIPDTQKVPGIRWSKNPMAGVR